MEDKHWHDVNRNKTKQHQIMILQKEVWSVSENATDQSVLIIGRGGFRLFSMVGEHS